ncbi:hypothetical protein EDC96DRAFT_546670 [Choanephora cucurbitarum]|nr:hypothetical protein EDC96DRAFT_546670 [Choanephora cucurbitarum]
MSFSLCTSAALLLVELLNGLLIGSFLALFSMKFLIAFAFSTEMCAVSIMIPVDSLFLFAISFLNLKKFASSFFCSSLFCLISSRDMAMHCYSLMRMYRYRRLFLATE